jgi:type I restriction enzyme, S subunit
MTVERVRVGDVLKLHRRAVEVEPSAEYREVGVRSFGRGIFHKEPIAGTDLGSKRVFRIEPGDLVISNVFAWEGAISVASEAEEGMIGSHRFMTFRPKDDRADTAWLAWFFLSEPGLELIRRASPGSAGRNRTLAIERFEALEIPLPSIDEQRRVARRLSQLDDAVGALSERLHVARQLELGLLDSVVSQHIGWTSGKWPFRKLAEVAIVNPPPTKLNADQTVAFVPMASVDARFGTIESPEMRLAGEIGPGYKQFRRGDVIFARITPCMQNGKSAVALGEVEYAYGSTEFHVMRPGPDVSEDWIHRVVRSRHFRLLAASRFTGTAGQQRVPADFLRTVEIPVPPPEEQAAIVAAVDETILTGDSVQRLRERSARVGAALIASASNEAFASLS